MADAAANLKKAQTELDGSKKAYERLEGELVKAMKHWLALTDDEKRIDGLKHVGDLSARRRTRPAMNTSRTRPRWRRPRSRAS